MHKASLQLASLAVLSLGLLAGCGDSEPTRICGCGHAMTPTLDLPDEGTTVTIYLKGNDALMIGEIVDVDAWAVTLSCRYTEELVIDRDAIAGYAVGNVLGAGIGDFLEVVDAFSGTGEAREGEPAGR
jgi:hypothetical protein